MRRLTNVVVMRRVERPHALFGGLDDPAVVRLGLGEQPVDPVAVRDVAHRDRRAHATSFVVREVVADELDREPVSVGVANPTKNGSCGPGRR